jgi:hypothetical protein
MAKFKACKGCGKHFQVASPNTGKRYCCNACRQRAYRRRQPPKPQRARLTFGERECEVCGARFEARHARQRFCSAACRQWLWRHKEAFEREYIYVHA